MESGVLPPEEPREKRSRCLSVIETLPLPRPFELERFRVALGRQRGRGLHFVQARGVRDGLWIAGDTADYLYYPADVPQLRQLQVIATELGHMLLDHEGTPTATNQMARLLLPSLDPALTISTLDRFRYTTAQRREAAAFADLLLDRMETAPPAVHTESA
jgi:hypothetical protein